ncbi:MAG: hypothetical protein LBJ36_07920 [Synergistaceae bacterium]|nr:hypothetical protein [Synergistaceae bacterium]
MSNRSNPFRPTLTWQRFLLGALGGASEAAFGRMGSAPLSLNNYVNE